MCTFYQKRDEAEFGTVKLDGVDMLRLNVLNWAFSSEGTEFKKCYSIPTHGNEGECTQCFLSDLSQTSSLPFQISFSKLSSSTTTDTLGENDKNNFDLVETEEEETFTSVNMSNFPRFYTNSHLVDLLYRFDYIDCVDFIYLPFRGNRNMAFAVINFTSHAEAAQFKTMFKGFSEWVEGEGCDPANKCELGWNHNIQGIDKLIAYYRDAPIMHSLIPAHRKPWLMKNRERVEFPPPTKVLTEPENKVLRKFKVKCLPVSV